MSEPSAYEQYALEIINAQRLNPQSAANLYGEALNSGLPAGTISAAQLQPLAFNLLLNAAAEDHSQWMLNVSTVVTAPFAYDDARSTDKVTTINLDVLSNDDTPGTFDPASLAVSNQSWDISKNDEPELSIKPDGTIDFDPRGAKGTFTFNYSITDSTGQSTTATATVVVADTDKTAAAADSYQTDTNEPLSLLGLLENDFYTEPDSQSTIKIKELPTNGDLFLNGELVIDDQVIPVTSLDNLVYRPNPGYSGNDQFLYELDSDGKSEASVNISVLPPASTSTAPFAYNDARGTDKVTTINLDVLSNDDTPGTFDPASLAVSNQSWDISKNDEPELSIKPDGTIDFDPRGAKGTFTFNYSITDSTGQSTTATATVVVADTDKTAAAADSYQTDTNEPLSLLGLLENDFYTEPDSQNTIKIKELPTNGDLFLNGELVIDDQVIPVTSLDNLVYRPNPGYSGNDQFLYELDSDGKSEASVNISVLSPASTIEFTGDSASAENLAFRGTTDFLDPLFTLEDRLAGLYDSALHRANTFDPQFREIGIGYELGQYKQYNAGVLTENFATSGSDKFITGVIYTDTDANDQFSYNEGVGGATIRIQPQGGSQEEFINYATGGYTASTTASGLIDVEFSRDGMTVVVTIEMGVDNVKVDLRDTNFIASSASAFLGEGAVGLELLGINDTDATGNDGENTIIGNSGDNRIAGGEASDTLTGNGGRDTFVFDNCHDGVDQITDFVSGTDAIEIGRLGFAQAMQLGQLGADSLVFGTTATQNQAQFLYDQSTGDLSIDMDGTGVGEALLFANLGQGTSLAYSDIVVTSSGRANSIVSQNIVTIENNGSYELAVNSDGAYLMTTGVGIPVSLQYFAVADVGPTSLARWSALQAEATATGFTVLWHYTNGGYALWQTDAAGNYISSYDLQEASLYGLETMFVVDFDGNGRIGVLEDNGAYELGVNADGAFHVSNSVGAPIVLKYGGSNAEYRTFDGWSSLQAEATATGFAVLWQHTNGSYALWQTDADGNYVSSYDLQEASLYGLEAMFDVDFNGDGAIAMIESDGAYQLSVDANGAFQISNGADTPTVLKYGGSDVEPRTFAGWSALQAEATATGFTVLWQHTNGNYALWQTDAAGNYLSSTSPSQASLTNIEAAFAVDLNGDGGIGVVEDNGAYQLSVNASGVYQIGDGVGASVVVKNGGSDIGPSSLAGWSALQAEATATGFAVLWNHTDGRYVVWETDAAGNYQSSKSLSETALNEIEAVFATDLNGDGGIAVIEDNGAFQLSISETGAYQFSDGAGAPVVLKNGGVDIGPDSLADWSAIQAEATDTGFAVLWQHDNGNHILWETDTAGNYQGSQSLSETALNEIEAVFAIDLNGDGGIAVIEDDGAFQLSISETGAYQFSDGNGAPVVLKNGGSDIGPDSLVGWSALQAEATATGFSVLWNHTDGRNIVWQTDTAGNYQSSLSLSETALNEIEAVFAADLNGDGGIAVIEDNGVVQLSIDENGAYQFDDGIGASIVLKNGSSDIGPSSLAGWSALQTEATATGFSVLWNHTDGRYVIWQADSAGNYESSYGLPESSLIEVEALFAADLNGDGGIGLV